MRLSHASRLVRELRGFPLPYIGRGFSFTNRIWEGYSAGRWPEKSSPLRIIDPTEKYDALIGLGDFWCHREHVQALIALKNRSRSTLVHLVHDLIAANSPQWTHPHYGQEFLDQLSRLAPHVDHWLVTSKYVGEQVSDYPGHPGLPQRSINIIPMRWPHALAY